MPLDLPSSSRFPVVPDVLPDEFVAEAYSLLLKISHSKTSIQDLDRQDILEDFKQQFSLVVGKPHYTSSSIGFAEFDLKERMREAKANAAVFLEALYDSVEAARAHGRYHAPDVEYLNDMCRRHSVPYVFEPPKLLRLNVSGVQQLVATPTLPPSLAENAAAMLSVSMKRAEELLLAGHAREAVQETLWMLESVTTAFRGATLPSGAVTGSYFNQIARELKASATGTTLARVIEWLSQLHGYLSSPTGGGVRHGIDIAEAKQLSVAEGRLYVNLILSYVTFLLAEYDHLAKATR